MKKINRIFLAAMLLTLNLCSEQESSPEKINNCFELADAIEEVFDTIQIEAYESEIYRTYSGLDATKLDYVYEALRINKIGIDYVGIGSDYDGLDCLPKSWNDCLDHMIIQECLEKRGYKNQEIEKIMGKNILRVLEDIYN